jgi:branched-chain amino acid transport system ATP-binding protein
LYRPFAGRIHFLGEDITDMTSTQVVQRGLIHVPEGRRIFPNMNVLENLMVGGQVRGRTRRQQNIDKVVSIFPRLQERFKQAAGTLSGGEQQMLAIGRALLSKPALMMLDEPSLGLSPLLVQALFGLLKDLNRDGLSILLVEQNTHMALATAHRAYVLELGRLVLQGNAQDIAADPRMAAAYLGA